MKLRSDRYVVPIVLVIAFLAALSVTVQWAPRPIPPLRLRVTMGPGDIDAVGKPYGLRFTPHNALSGHTLMSMVPSQRRCIDVEVTDSALTSLDQERACRLADGSYKAPYTFRNPNHYIVFTTIQPTGGLETTARFPVALTYCERRHYVGCHPPAPLLRGLETVRTHVVKGVTILFTGPTGTVKTGRPVQFTFSFLRNGRVVRTVEPGAPHDVVAVSLDTFHLVHLNAVKGQIVHGRFAAGSATFSGVFDAPSIYRLFVAPRFKGRALRTSFVVDVDPAPKPTSVPADN